MNKHEKRYHKTIGNKVASLYIKECWLPKTTTYSYKGESISTIYYEYIGACVSNNKRANNDWWNGDKRGNNFHNVSTGTATTFFHIISMLKKHIDAFMKEYGYYCCMIDGTDDHRLETYINAVYHYAKKNKLTLTTVATDDGLLCYFE